MTTINTDPILPLVRIVREFDGPPSAVFDAHTDAARLALWFGPHQSTLRVDTWKCEPGGAFRYALVFGDFEAAFHGCFHTVRPSELIVQTLTFEGVPNGVALEKLVFEELDGQRTRLTSTSLVDDFVARDAFFADMQDGTRASYERLDDLLAG